LGGLTRDIDHRVLEFGIGLPGISKIKCIVKTVIENPKQNGKIKEIL